MAIRDTNFINSGIYRVTNNTAIPTPVNNPASNPADMQPTPDRIVMGNIIGTRSQRGNQTYIWQELAPGIAAWVPENTSQENTDEDTMDMIPRDRDMEDMMPDDDDDDYYEEADDTPVPAPAPERVMMETDSGYFTQDASGRMVFHPRV